MNARKARRVARDRSGPDAPVALFRVSGAVRQDPAVIRWLNDDSNPFRAPARSWFARLRQCGDDVLMGLHDGCPVACIEDAPFAYVNTFSRHLSVGFFYGAWLPDPAGLLEGEGKRMRHVKRRPGQATDDDALRTLIDAAYVDLRARLTSARPA